MQLTHIRLLVTDFDECFRFYRDVMGFKVLWGREGGGYADFQAGEGPLLALFGRREMAASVGTLGLPEEADSQDRAMLIFHVDDLEATVARLGAKGADFVAGIQDHPEWGIRTAHLRDPEDTLIELNAPMPQSEWTDDLLAAAQQQTSGHE